MYNKRKFNLFKMYNLKYNKNNIKSFMFNIITIAVGLAVFFAIQVVNLVNKNEIYSGTKISDIDHIMENNKWKIT